MVQGSRRPPVSFEVRVLFGLTILSVMGYLAAGLFANWKEWERLQVEAPVSFNEWRFLLDPENASCEKGAPPEACPASFANDQIRAEGSLPSSDPLASEKFAKGNYSEAWFELRVPPARASQLVHEGTLTYLLGWVRGDIAVWSNGALIYEAVAVDRKPHLISVPRLGLESEGLKLVLRLRIEPGTIDAFSEMRGFQAGFTTYEKAASFERFFDFVEKSKSFSLALVYLTLGFIFQALWLSDRQCREYFYISLFALVNVIPELLFGSWTLLRIESTWAFHAYLAWLTLKCASSLSLGLSLSRVSSSRISKLAFAVLALGGIALATLSAEPIAYLRRVLTQVLVPGIWITCAVICWRQLREFGGEGGPKLSRFRKRQIVGSSVTMLFMAVALFLQLHSGTDMVSRALLWAVPELFIFGLLSYFAVLTYSRQTRQLAATPVSRYHRSHSLPQAVTGVVVRLDLKNSEYLYRAASATGEVEVSTIVSHIWRTAEDCGGVVLKADGDEMNIFFDEQDYQNPYRPALVLCDRLVVDLRSLADRLSLAELGDFHFRAAVAKGAIRPQWTGTQASRLPTWGHANDSVVFVQVARLLEIEKVLAEDQGLRGSNVLVDHPEGFDLSVFGEDRRECFVRTELSAPAKHGNVYRFSVYVPHLSEYVRLKPAA